MALKDRFSVQSTAYATYRPSYPESLFDFLVANVPAKHTALDVATGNGQVASRLADSFGTVIATDISDKQLKHAIAKKNIHYQKAPAEKLITDLSSIDLITVGQAAHWFDLSKFFDAADNMLKPGGLLALFGYSLPTVDNEVDFAIKYVYSEILGNYWDKERKMVDEQYANIAFPYTKINHPDFIQEYEWTFEQYLGYIGTWSAVQLYQQQHHIDLQEEIKNRFKEVWKSETKKVRFPIFLLAGRK